MTKKNTIAGRQRVVYVPRPSPYPARITRAAAAVTLIEFRRPLGLSMADGAALARLICDLDAQAPGQPFRVDAGALAAVFLCSRHTVARWLKRLVDAGALERPAPGLLRLTDSTLHALGLA